MLHLDSTPVAIVIAPRMVIPTDAPVGRPKYHPAPASAAPAASRTMRSAVPTFLSKVIVTSFLSSMRCSLLTLTVEAKRMVRRTMTTRYGVRT